MSRFKGFTPEQHKDVSARLRSIEQELQAVCSEIWRAYGVSSRSGRAIERIVAGKRTIVAVRLAMEDAACREFGNDVGMSIYAGRNSQAI